MVSAPLATLDLLSARAPLKPLGTVAFVVRDHINASTMMSWTSTDWSFCGTEWSMDRLIMKGNVLPLQRNECVQRMRGGFLIFIDDDMVWSPDAIGNLIDSYYELDRQFIEPIIVGGLCFRRSAPYMPTLYMRDTATEGTYRFLETWKDGLVEVDATGCAFLLIPVTALEAIAESEQPPYDVRIAQPPPGFFRWQGRLGEDLRFCQDFKAKGGRIFVDTRIQVRHVAEVEIGHEHFLQEIALRSPEDEAHARELNDNVSLPTLTSAEARTRLGWQT